MHHRASARKPRGDDAAAGGAGGVCGAAWICGTPAWPWFQSFLAGESAGLDFGRFGEAGLLPLMAVSSLIVFCGLGLGWWFYGRKPILHATDPDALEKIQPGVFHALANRLYVDELYGVTVIALTRFCAGFAAWLDRWIFGGAVRIVAWDVTGVGWLDAGGRQICR